MRASVHGRKRVQERTKMHIEDVLLLLEAGATINLGVHRNGTYLLFWSNPDEESKIAIVDKSQGMLITIIENAYAVPNTITPFTRELEQRARDLWRMFAKEKVVVKD